MSGAKSLEPIVKAFEGFLDASSKAVGTLNSTGEQLLASIAIMLLIYKTLLTLLEGGGGRKIASNAIYLAMMTSFAFVIIANLGKISSIFISSADSIVEKVVPAKYLSGSSKTGELAVRSFAPMLSAASAIMEMTAGSSAKQIDDECEGNAMEMTPDGPSFTPCTPKDGAKEGGSWYSGLWAVVTFLSYLPMMLLSFMLKSLAIIFLITAGCIAMGHILISQILVHIALIVAPLLIPFMIWEAASFMFDGWLKFFIKALFHKIIGVIILASMAQGIMEGVKAVNGIQATQTGVGQLGELAMYTVTNSAIMVALSILTVMLAGQIPNIADGLLAGMSRSGLNLNPRMPNVDSKESRTQDTPKAILAELKQLNERFEPPDTASGRTGKSSQPGPFPTTATQILQKSGGEASAALTTARNRNGPRTPPTRPTTK